MEKPANVNREGHHRRGRGIGPRAEGELERARGTLLRRGPREDGGGALKMPPRKGKRGPETLP